VVAFQDEGISIMDARLHAAAATELLTCGALKNRNMIRQGAGKGAAVIYQWTELVLRASIAMLTTLPTLLMFKRAGSTAQSAVTGCGSLALSI
jgi:hypothetical protein